MAVIIHQSDFFGSDEILEIPDSLQNRLPHPDRPKCNSILHLIGSWLFEAAFIGSEYSKHPADQVAPHVNDQLTHKISLPAPSLSPKPVRRLDHWTSVKNRLLLFFLIRASFWIYFLLFLWYIVKIQLINFALVNDDRKQRRKSKSMHHSITCY